MLLTNAGVYAYLRKNICDISVKFHAISFTWWKDFQWWPCEYRRSPLACKGGKLWGTTKIKVNNGLTWFFQDLLILASSMWLWNFKWLGGLEKKLWLHAFSEKRMQHVWNMPKIAQLWGHKKFRKQWAIKMKFSWYVQ